MSYGNSVQFSTASYFENCKVNVFANSGCVKTSITMAFYLCEKCPNTDQKNSVLDQFSRSVPLKVQRQ